MANVSQAVNSHTLEDDAWKDSFDKLLDDRSVLREKNLLKPVVRASFNINSSVESGGKNNSSVLKLGVSTPSFVSNGVGGRGKNKKGCKSHGSVSTPIGNQARNPFKCSLSPIGAWKMTLFGKTNNNKRRSRVKFHATLKNPDIIVVDYDASQESNQNKLSTNINTTSKAVLAPIPLEPKRKTVFAKKMEAILSEKDSMEMNFFRPNAMLKHSTKAKRKHSNRVTAEKNSQLKAKQRRRSKRVNVGKKSSKVQRQGLSAVAQQDSHEIQQEEWSVLTFDENAFEAQKERSTNTSVTQSQVLPGHPTEAISFGAQQVLPKIIVSENNSLGTRLELLTGADKENDSSASLRKCSSVLALEKNSEETEQQRSSVAGSVKGSSKPQKESNSAGVLKKDSLHPTLSKKKVVMFSDKGSMEVQAGRSSVLASQTSSVETQRGRSIVMASRASKEFPFGPVLQPGKWRKSLNHWRRTSQMHYNEVRSSNVLGLSVIEDSVEFISSTTLVGQRKSVFINVEKRKQSSVHYNTEWKRRVFQYCKQRQPLDFERVYIADDMKKCKKIGEGVYGEVFINDSKNEVTVVKVIPIEGQQMVNGEKQKTFEQILPEIVISFELSQLREAPVRGNSTCGFVTLKKVNCVKGKYPAHMIKLWEEYDNDKGSENDHPKTFTDGQLYITLELAFGGCDLESYVFNNAEQVYHALQQIILTLAVGEEAFQFEHRDLHWGNVLVLRTSEKQLTYKLNNRCLTIPTKGVKATIIDYTLSRMTFDNCCHYNDLSSDEELFGATGDYQFDIYRMMRDAVKNNWETFEPKTNVFWISYLISKMLNGVSYKNKSTKVHTTYMTKLRKLQDVVLDFPSAVYCAQYLLKLA